MERAGRVLGFIFPKTTREGRGADTRRARGSSSLPWRGEVASSWRTEGHAAAASYARSDMAVHRIQIFNSTSNIPLRPILRASVTPKPRRVSKNSINKSCRSTYQLQLLLKLQSLIRPGLGDTRFQNGYTKTKIMHSVIHDLAKFQVLKTATNSKFEPRFDLLTS